MNESSVKIEGLRMRAAALLFRSADLKIDPESPAIKNTQFPPGELGILKHITQNFCGLIEISFMAVQV
jgi:hypothetical protein